MSEKTDLSHYIPRRLDDGAKFLFWEMDVAMIGLMGVLVGIGCCRRRKSVEIWRHKTAAEFGVDRLTHKGPGGPLVIYGRWGQKGGSFSGGSLRVMRSSRYRSSKAIS